MSAVLEKNNDLPKGWSIASIGEVATISTGKRDANHATKDGEYKFFTCAFEPLAASTFAFDDEALLLPGNGHNVGEVFYYKGKFEAYQRTYVLHDIKIEPKYLFYNLKLRWRKETSEKQYGSATNYIRIGNFTDYNLHIAPSEQQKLIVAKIEELFSHIDAGIKALKKAKQLLKQYRQSVLKAAVTGELTKEWRKQNNFSKESWQESSIGEIANVQTGKTPRRSNEEFWKNGTVPWLTSSATNKTFIHHADQFVTQVAVDSGLKLFESGTLLLAMYGEGKTRGQVTEITFQSTCNQACAAIIVNENKASRAFVRLRLNENYEQTRKAASGGNQPNLNLTKVREISLPLPPLVEQAEIVTQVEQKIEAINRLENDIKKQLFKTDVNKQSVLASAFSGRLK